MPDLVCTGATLQCSFGTSPATFSATGAKVSAGTAAGVVSDTGAASVRAFGNCMSPNNPAVSAAQGAPQPCQPVLTGDWTPGSARARVGPAAALTSDSQCFCSWGGVITVTNAGQARATLG